MRFLCTLLISMSFLCQSVFGQEESIYNPEIPEIQTVWYRIADISPKLRAVESAEFSQDGLLAVSGSKFGYKVMLWRVLDGSLIWENQHEAEVECVSFSPDGTRIASGGEDYKVRIWDVTTGQQLHEWEHPSGLDGITWSHDGMTIASGAEDGTVYFWNAITYSQLWKIKVGSTVNSLQFTSDDRQIVVGGNYQKFDSLTNKTLYTGFAKLIDLESRLVIKEFGEHSASVKSVRISPDQKYVATGGFASEVKIFELSTGRELVLFPENMRVEAVAFTPDGQYLITGGHGNAITFYRLKDYQRVLEFPSPRIDYIDVSEDGRLLLTAHEDSGLLGLHMFLSNLQHRQGLYQQIADRQLQNRDLKN